MPKRTFSQINFAEFLQQSDEQKASVIQALIRELKTVDMTKRIANYATRHKPYCIDANGQRTTNVASSKPQVTASAASTKRPKVTPPPTTTATEILVPFEQQPPPPVIAKEIIAIDVEKVQVGKELKAAYVAVVAKGNKRLFQAYIYRRHVRKGGEVTNWATRYSGITEALCDNKSNIDITDARNQLIEIFKGRTVVGHALTADLESLDLNIWDLRSNQKLNITFVDTQEYFRYPVDNIHECGGQPISLKLLVQIYFQDENFQKTTQHCPVQDARYTGRLYTEIILKDAFLPFDYETYYCKTKCHHNKLTILIELMSNLDSYWLRKHGTDPMCHSSGPFERCGPECTEAVQSLGVTCLGSFPGTPGPVQCQLVIGRHASRVVDRK